MNLTAITQGPDPSYNGGISHSNPSGYFPNSSFNASPLGATAMSGGAAGAPSIYSYALGFAADGSITSGNDSANGNWTYGYDEFNRLTSSNKNSGAQTFTYAYDRLGNRWQQNAPQGGPAPQYNFDSNNHISGSGITYDALGNILTDGLGNSYSWDAENRLASINGGAWSYVYDALGRRVAKKQNGTINSEFLYDLSGDKVTSLDGSGNATAEEIYAGGRHLATYLASTNSTYFHHPDWLGNLRTDSGVNGASTQTCTGLPFGDGAGCTGTFSSANLFTDDFHDAEDNLEHTLFRKLSTTQGRWMTPDPSGMAAVDFTNPQSLNMYAYTWNNPMAAFDPLGLKQCNPDKPDVTCVIQGQGPNAGCTVDGLAATCSSAAFLANTGAGRVIVFVTLPPECWISKWDGQAYCGSGDNVTRSALGLPSSIIPSQDTTSWLSNFAKGFIDGIVHGVRKDHETFSDCVNGNIKAMTFNQVDPDKLLNPVLLIPTTTVTALATIPVKYSGATLSLGSATLVAATVGMNPLIRRVIVGSGMGILQTAAVFTSAVAGTVIGSSFNCIAR